MVYKFLITFIDGTTIIRYMQGSDPVYAADRFKKNTFDIKDNGTVIYFGTSIMKVELVV